MKTLPLFALAIVLLGAATLLAAPEEEAAAPPFGIPGALEVGADQAGAIAKALAEKPAWHVRVEATFLRVDAARAAEILGGQRPDELGSARAIPQAFAERLLAPLRVEGPIRPEPPTRLVLYDGQRGRLASMGQHTYLQDYDVEVTMGGSRIGDPVAALLTDGASLDVTPRRDAKRLLLDVEAVWGDLLRPVPLFETDLGGTGPKVTIELPEMRIFHVKETVALPATGGFVLAGDGKAWDGGTLRLVVLEVRP